MLEATCHCGAVRIEIDELPAALTDCNCSVCSRYSALWCHLTRATARIHSAPGIVSAYLCNDEVIEFYHCRKCGCVTHYESIDKAPDQRIAINFNMFPAKDIGAIEIRYFDGADSWKFFEKELT